MADWKRYSARVIRSPRWQALRLAALRRDDWRCVKCGAVGRLEVDHVRPVRDATALAFELSNLQALCPSCHSKKTRAEIGLPPPNPERLRWRAAIDELTKSPPTKG